MSTENKLLSFSDRDEQCQVLSSMIAAQLRSALKKNNRASLVVSGGSTPVPMFKALNQQVLDWKNVSILLADERWLTPDHKDSNTRLVHQHLLQNQASTAQFIPMWNDAASLEEGVELTNKSLAALDYPFDVVILGMGDDGHTASIFPCAPSDERDRGLNTDSTYSVVKMNPSTAPYQRISMTYNRLINTRSLILHIAGEGKLEVLKQAQQDTAIESMPIRAFLQQTTVPLEIYWVE